MKKTLITGITGQDGSYLAELLLEKGYEVHGLVRRVAVENQEDRLSRIGHLLTKITLHYGDVADYATVWRVVAKVMPDELYHLAAQSQVWVSFKDEFGAFKTNTESAHYFLSAIRELKPDCKFYFAGTSEMFGDARISPQNETTPFNPVSPYGISKAAGFHLVKMYREAYRIFACTGILFNHESPRRGYEFVTRKITSTAARIKIGLAKELRLGNLAAKRDWGFAKEYIEAMWLMLQEDRADDYVIGTGEMHTIQECAEIAFSTLGLDWQKYIVRDDALLRPLEVHHLCADASKARRILNWSARTKFHDLITMMTKADREKLLVQGHDKN